MKSKRPLKCAFPGCKTELNRYNDGRYCYIHQRPPYQELLDYIASLKQALARSKSPVSEGGARPSQEHRAIIQVEDESLTMLLLIQFLTYVKSLGHFLKICARPGCGRLTSRPRFCSDRCANLYRVWKSRGRLKGCPDPVQEFRRILTPDNLHDAVANASEALELVAETWAAQEGCAWAQEAIQGWEIEKCLPPQSPKSLGHKLAARRR